MFYTAYYVLCLSNSVKVFFLEHLIYSLTYIDGDNNFIYTP